MSSILTQKIYIIKTKVLKSVQKRGIFMSEQKIKQDEIFIGSNIRRLRKEKNIRQVDMVIKLQLLGVDMTREALVKIERGIQHIYATQLKAIKEVLDTSYDELLK